MLGFSAVSEAPVSDLGATGVTNNQTITVTSTSITLLQKTPRKIVVVTSTSVTTLARLVAKLVPVASTSVILAVKRASRAVAVVSTSVVAAVKAVGKLVAVASTSASAFAKQARKVMVVASTSTTTLAKQARKIVAVTSTSIVSSAKAIGKIVNVASSSLVAILSPILRTFSLAVTEARDTLLAFLFRGKFDYVDAEVFDVTAEGKTFRALQDTHTYPDALPFAVPRENTLYSATSEIQSFKAAAKFTQEVIDPVERLFRANPRLRK